MSAAEESIVVVGASLAGMRAAETLRAEGFSGAVTVVGAEHVLPYDRPPLSKQYLVGTWDAERIRLREADKAGALGLDLRLGRRAVALDPAARRVELDDGAVLQASSGVVVATGAHPRWLPGTEGLAGVHTLRTLEDADRLRAALVEGARVVVVGGGFIGSEVASSARVLGADVTLVEFLPFPLARVLGERVGAVCAALHGANGVRVRTGVGVEAVVATPDGAAALEVRLADGVVLPADAVVVGIGVTPTVEWLESSGLALDDGVLADATLHAADGVVVAGDLARWRHPDTGADVRIEHWTNATEQGVVAARNLLAGRAHAAPYAPVPYVWSDQHDVKIQVIGLPHPDDDLEVVAGDLEARRFVALYGRGVRMSAAVGFGMPRQLMAARASLVERAPFAEALARARA